MNKLSMLFLLLALGTIFTSCKEDEEVTPKAPEYGEFTDSRDSAVYKTVTLGDQVWMAENLRYNATGSYLNPNNPTDKYGRLYDWSTVMAGASSSDASPSGVQGICPSGWHLPSDEEWKILEMHLGMSRADADDNLLMNRGSNQATQLKSTSGWAQDGDYGNGSNSSGFNALPAGSYSFGSFDILEENAQFWTSTEKDGTHAWMRNIFYDAPWVNYQAYIKTAGNSCRCVQD